MDMGHGRRRDVAGYNVEADILRPVREGNRGGAAAVGIGGPGHFAGAAEGGGERPFPALGAGRAAEREPAGCGGREHGEHLHDHTPSSRPDMVGEPAAPN